MTSQQTGTTTLYAHYVRGFLTIRDTADLDGGHTVHTFGSTSAVDVPDTLEANGYNLPTEGRCWRRVEHGCSVAAVTRESE